MHCRLIPKYIHMTKRYSVDQLIFGLELIIHIFIFLKYSILGIHCAKCMLNSFIYGVHRICQIEIHLMVII